MDVVRELAERIGPRPAGSSAETAAASYVAEAATDLGAEVDRQEFLFRAWSSGDRAALVLDGAGDRLELVGHALPYTAATPRGGLAGTLERALEWPLVPGRITCDSYRLRDASERVVAAILVSPFGSSRQLPNPRPLIALPTLVVGREDGRALARALTRTQGPLPGVLQIDAHREELLRSQNVIADVGTGPRCVVVVAHLDSVPGSPGANDNAAGVATALRLLETASARPRGAPRIRFVFSGAEEPFLVGARMYATTLLAAQEVDNVGACLNLDMVAVGEHFVIRRPDAGLWATIAEATAADTRMPVPITCERSTPASDHWAFHELGIMSAQLTRISDVLYHLPGDDLGRVCEQALDDATTTAQRLLDEVVGHVGGRVARDTEQVS